MLNRNVNVASIRGVGMLKSGFLTSDPGNMISRSRITNDGLELEFRRCDREIIFLIVVFKWLELIKNIQQ